MSDSTASEDEIQIKKYFNNDLLSAIKQAKRAQESATGIKIAPGHHLLRNKKQVVIVKKVNAYDGKHWDVDCDNGLERATKRSTISAINAEMDKEQLRRVKSGAETRRKAKEVLRDLHREYFKNLSHSKSRQKAEDASALFGTENKLSDVHSELLRKVNTKDIVKKREAEKERQMKLVSKMKNKASRTLSQEDLLLAMAENNRKKSLVHADLLEGFARYREAEHDVTNQYDSAMFEVKDESLNIIKKIFHREKAKHLTTEEQTRRVTDLRPLMKERHYQVNMHHFNKVMSSLRNAFKKAKDQEKGAERVMKNIIEERKTLMQEELIQQHAFRWVDFACAKERLRQIAECEKYAQKSDPYHDAVKLSLAKVQREMILLKFNGKWVDKRKKEGEEGPVESASGPMEELSLLDQKLKSQRLKARRKSCVIKGEEA